MMMGPNNSVCMVCISWSSLWSCSDDMMSRKKHLEISMQLEDPSCSISPCFVFNTTGEVDPFCKMHANWHVWFYFNVWRWILMGKPFGNSTKGKTNAWSSSTNSHLKLRTKWWTKTAISSFARSDPAQSRGPPPNGMKLLFVDGLGLGLGHGHPEADTGLLPLFCCITITGHQVKNNIIVNIQNWW